MAKQGRNRSRIVDRKWEKIFDDLDVLDHIKRDGYYVISSNTINQYKEARLMTNFDHISSLPNIFHYNDLAILPTRRGEYMIAHFDAYQRLHTDDRTLLTDRKEIVFPDWIETISPKNITSESTTINAAAATGIIQDLFNEDHIIQTVSGRMSSKDFTFNISDTVRGGQYTLDVNNAQVEIDGGFETPDKLILFEAKNTTLDTFLIRQLYYPYQLWAKQTRKEVVPVFLQYVNDTFNFSVFAFDDVNDYSSIRLVKRKNYIFGGEHTTLDDLADIFRQVPIVPEDASIPFPQANTFTRVIGVVESIWNSPHGFITLEDLSLSNDFVMRQAQYYSRAAIYLGLVEQVMNNKYVLTDLGEKYIQGKRRERNLLIAGQILEHQSFHAVFGQGLRRGAPLNTEDTYNFLDSKKYYEAHLSPSTRKRRASTISSWVRYLFDLVE